MNLQAEDKSNKALTVGSLNVLGGIKSDELTAIHTHLQTQDGVQSRITADMEKLYQSISADGVITANEKQMLKKELTIIETEYPIILAKAEAAKKRTVDIEKYKEVFQKLYHYIYSELKVFDSMQTPLEIERTTFNAIFAAYYSSRALLQITQDGTTKFLPSLEIPGDYENQIGTFQGRLYRWTGGKWELLNAVMPLNPICHYDFGKDSLHLNMVPCYDVSNITENKKSRVIVHWSLLQNNTLYHIKISSSWSGDAKPYLSVFSLDWKNIPINVPINDTQEFIVFIPNGRPYGMGVWMHSSEGYIPRQGDSVTIDSLVISELKSTLPLDCSGNGNRGLALSSIPYTDGNIGTAILFQNSNSTGKPFQTLSNITSINEYYVTGFRIPDNNTHRKVVVTAKGRVKKGNGQIRIFVFNGEWTFVKEVQITSHDFTTVTLEAVIPQHTDVHVGIWNSTSEELYKTTEIEVQELKATIVQQPVLLHKPFFKSSLQWSHSRWINLEEGNTYGRLYYYGHKDYANIYDNKTIGFGTQTQKGEMIARHVAIDSFKHRWAHLVVTNSLINNTFIKKIYINGQLIETITQEGVSELSTFSYHFHSDMGDIWASVMTVNGSLANLLFFDRVLTEQEVLYLYLNPQYPVKNYTLADWAIDPANPDSSIKNLTPKYLGVTETVPAIRTVVITKGEKLGAQDAHAGDWVLMSKTVGGWKCGVCYRWTGSMWINLEPEYNYTEQYQAALYHICEIPELMQNTGHFGALFAKVLVAQQAFIDKLVAQEAFIKKLATEQAFLRQLVVQRLKIDSDDTTHQDFEAWFDETNGLKINNKEQEIFRIAPNGSILMGNNIFFKYLPYHSAGRLLCSESDTVKHFCETHGFDTFSVIGIHNGKSFSKIQTSKTEKYNMWFLGMLPKAIEPRPVFRLLSLKTVKYELTLYFNNGETYTIYYKNYPDMPEHTDDVYLYYNFEKRGYWSKDVNDVYTPQQVNDQLNFNAYIGVKEMNYVMTIENIPTYKPNGSGIVWKDGDFLKIS